MGLYICGFIPKKVAPVNGTIALAMIPEAKKALSHPGFSVDVWPGWHDIPEYLAENVIKHGIKNAGEKTGDTVRRRKEAGRENHQSRQHHRKRSYAERSQESV